MTAAQQANARLIWVILVLILIGGTLYSDPTIVLPSALVGWFGGISFVYAWLVKPQNQQWP